MSKLLKGKGVLTLILPILFGASLLFTQTTWAGPTVVVEAGYSFTGIGNVDIPPNNKPKDFEITITASDGKVVKCPVKIGRGSYKGNATDDYCATTSLPCTLYVSKGDDGNLSKITIYPNHKFDVTHRLMSGTNVGGCS